MTTALEKYAQFAWRQSQSALREVERSTNGAQSIARIMRMAAEEADNHPSLRKLYDSSTRAVHARIAGEKMDLIEEPMIIECSDDYYVPAMIATLQEQGIAADTDAEVMRMHLRHAGFQSATIDRCLERVRTNYKKERRA